MHKPTSVSLNPLRPHSITKLILLGPAPRNSSLFSRLMEEAPPRRRRTCFQQVPAQQRGDASQPGSTVGFFQDADRGLSLACSLADRDAVLGNWARLVFPLLASRSSTLGTQMTPHTTPTPVAMSRWSKLRVGGRVAIVLTWAKCNGCGISLHPELLVSRYIASHFRSPSVLPLALQVTHQPALKTLPSSLLPHK